MCLFALNSIFFVRSKVKFLVEDAAVIVSNPLKPPSDVDVDNWDLGPQQYMGGTQWTLCPVDVLYKV